MFNNSRKTGVAWLASACALTLATGPLSGCGGAADDAEQISQTGHIEQGLASDAGTSLWPNGIVPMCWDSSFANHARFAEMSARILEIANDHYERAANIHFEDAGRCPANPIGALEVFSITTLPHNAAEGYRTGGDAYVSFNIADLTTTPATTQQIVLHELGHALGFMHEFKRPDWTNGCDFEQNAAGAWNAHGTSADFNSIMASTYCQQNTVLSPTDVTGLQVAYGTPGAQRLNAAATDSGQDVMWHWYGGGWHWSELFANVDNVSSRASVATFRVGSREQMRSFALDGTGLVQQYWDGASWTRAKWTDKALDLAPDAVAYRDYGTGAGGSFATSSVKWYAFTRDTAGNLVARHWNGSAWSWSDLGKPAGGNIQHVSAITFNDFAETTPRVYAFVKAANGEIYTRFGNGSPASWSGSLGKPGAGSAGPLTASTFRDCVGGGCAADLTRGIHVWMVSNGSLWLLHWNGTAWGWVNPGQPAGTTLAAVKPSVVKWTETGGLRHGIFVLDTSSNLVELRWNGSAWSWISHSKPAGVSSLSAPSATTYRAPQLPALTTGVTTTVHPRHVFVVGNDGKAYVRYTLDGTNWAWADQTTPYGNVPLNQSRGITAKAFWSR